MDLSFQFPHKETHRGNYGDDRNIKVELRSSVFSSLMMQGASVDARDTGRVCTQSEDKGGAECYAICVLALNHLLIELLQFSGVANVAKVTEKTQQKCRVREMKDFFFHIYH